MILLLRGLRNTSNRDWKISGMKVKNYRVADYKSALEGRSRMFIGTTKVVP